MFRVPAANVKISCCQIVKSDSSRKVWEKKVKRGGVELKPGGGNPEETIIHAQDRPGDGNRRNKIPGCLESTDDRTGKVCFQPFHAFIKHSV